MTFIAQWKHLFRVGDDSRHLLLLFAYQPCLSASKLGAKRLLHASVIYLPLLYLFMILARSSYDASGDPYGKRPTIMRF